MQSVGEHALCFYIRPFRQRGQMIDDADDSGHPSGVPARQEEDVRARASEPLSVEEVLARDDLDAALRFFAAARETANADAQMGAPASGDDVLTLDFSRFRARRVRTRLLALVEELAAAIARRDLQGVWGVLDKSDACRFFPIAVREEALAIAGLPPTVVRVPTRLYHYHHTLTQLGDEPIEHELDPLQPPLAPGSESDRESAGRDITFSDRQPPRGGPRSGPDRRRSGSR